MITPKIAKGKRVKPTTGVMTELELFYGSRCVVEDTPNPEPHHLDENPRNSIFSNLIPINRQLNGDIEYRHGEVDIAKIIHAAKERFSLSWFARSYGCWRTVCFVADKCEHPELVMEGVQGVIESIRPIGRFDLLEDTLVRNLVPLIKQKCWFQKVGAGRFADLCDEISSLLRENGNTLEHRNWARLAERFLKITEDGNRGLFRRLQVLRHAAFEALECGDLKSSEILRGKVYSFAEENGMDKILKNRKSHILFEQRFLLQNKKFDELSQEFSDAETNRLMLKASDSKLAPKKFAEDRVPLDIWAEYHMQTIRAERLRQLKKGKKARDLIEVFASEYTQKNGIRATRAGMIPVLRAYLSRDPSFSLFRSISGSLVFRLEQIRFLLLHVVECKERKPFVL